MLALALITVVAAAPPAPLTPKEIIALLDASPRHYKIDEAKDVYDQQILRNLDTLWPRARPEFEFPTVDANKRVVELAHNTEVDALLERAEPLYDAKDYAAAEKIYGDALKVAPTYLPAMLSYGDAALFGGDPKTAVARYEKAIAVAPLDHRAYFFKGNALLAQGDVQGALDAYAWGLTVRPRAKLMLDGIQNQGFTVANMLLRPPVSVTMEGDAIHIVSPSNHWLIYGMCKGMWLGEPDHVKAMTGLDKRQFTTTEESECIVNVLAAYQGEKAKRVEDPVLDRLFEVAKAHQLTEMILFELGSRVDPHVMLTVPPEVRQRVHDYVRAWVLRPPKKNE